MKQMSTDTISQWFDGLNRGDKEGIVGLFAASPKIRNAASPSIQGPDALHRLLDELFSRTVTRHFVLIDAAESQNVIFAAWTAQITLREGITIAGKTVETPVKVHFRGIDRMHLDGEGKIEELVIENETTSIPRAVIGAAAAGQPEPDYAELIKNYFEAEEEGDIERAVALFHDDCLVINAAQAPQHGKVGARAYLESFKSRTSRRHFDLGDIAIEDSVAFASFSALITFNEGVTFGSVVARGSFDITLPGIVMFKFERGLVKELWMCHETTSTLRLAQKTVE